MMDMFIHAPTLNYNKASYIFKLINATKFEQ
jgi:hypothetical protein